MYNNNRNKQKEPEINHFRTCPLETWKTTDNQRQQQAPQQQSYSEPLLDPELITKHFQQLQYYNYMQYIQQMQQATGQNNIDPLGLGFDPALVVPPPAPFAGKIQGLPPGRPNFGTEKPKLTRANMTYGEHKQQSDPTYKPATSSYQSRDFDPRNGKNRQKVDDGWGDDNKPAPKRSLPPPSDDWDDEPAVVNKPASKRSLPPPSDDWDDEPEQPVKKKPARNDDDWSEFEPVQMKRSSGAPATSKLSTAKTMPSKADDWSDDEETKPKKRDYEDEPARGGSFSSRDNSRYSSRGNDSHRGNYRSGSQATDRSFGSDRSNGSGARQPRDGDWNCTKCKCSNFKFRRECYRCQEPKGDAVATEASGGYQRREGFRGGYRGGFRNNSRGGSNFKSRDSKPVSSGWSDDEADKTVAKVEVIMPEGGDDWDDEPKKEPSKESQKESRKRPADDDDWDNLDAAPAAKKPAKEEDSWDDFDAPAASNPSKSTAKIDDSWDEIETPKSLKTNDNDGEKVDAGNNKVSSGAGNNNIEEFDILSGKKGDESSKSQTKPIPSSNDDDDWD